MAASISIRELSAAVNTAVKAAVQKHPDFNIHPTNDFVYHPYWIVGIPIPDIRIKELGQLQTLAAELTTQIQKAAPTAFSADAVGSHPVEPAVYIHGKLIICGYRAMPQQLPGIRE